MARVAPTALTPAAPIDEVSSTPYSSFTRSAAVTLDFAPRATDERLPVQTVRSATTNIKLQSYDLETPKLRNAVLYALNKQVTVEIMVDQTIFLADKKRWNDLKRAGAKILINPRSGHAHDKTIIVDDTRVLLGSVNYRRDGRDGDLANTVLIEDPNVTKVYLAHWAQHADLATAK